MHCRNLLVYLMKTPCYFSVFLALSFAMAGCVSDGGSAADSQDYRELTAFLEGNWHCHIAMRAPNGVLLQDDYDVLITVLGRDITVTKGYLAKPFLKGTIKSADYRSVRWMISDDTGDRNSQGYIMAPARDASVNVFVTKTPPQIRWQQPQIVLGISEVSWSAQFGPKEFILTK
jgi:hypothetical protein